MKTIVALLNFSDVTYRVVKQAHQFAKAFDSHVVLLHVVNGVEVGLAKVASVLSPEAPLESMVGELKQLESLRSELAGFGVKVTTHPLGDPSVEGLLEETQSLGADLIIVGSHRHGELYNLLVGSVTDNILRRAHCPVLVVPDSGD